MTTCSRIILLCACRAQTELPHPSPKSCTPSCTTNGRHCKQTSCSWSPGKLLGAARIPRLLPEVWTGSPGASSDASAPDRCGGAEELPAELEMFCVPADASAVPKSL
eukprot:2899106-Amphidinium_carterae.1